MRRAALAATLAAGLLGCFEAVGPGGGRATISLVPVFEGAALLAGEGTDVDSFVITIVNPPAAPRDTSIVIPPGQDSIVLALTVEIGGAEDTIQLDFRGYSSQTGQLLYQGTQTVAVKAGVPTPPTPVPASYVGPGAGIDSITVAPAAATIAPAGTLQLTFTGWDNDAPMPEADVPVRWRSLDTAVARVSALGLVTGVADGTAPVVVTSVARSALRDTAIITVGAAPAPAIGLSPGSITFTWAAGAAAPASQAVSITNTGTGTLSGLAVGTITYGAGASGWLTAGLSGATAPATLTLAPATLPTTAGSYTASVPVTAAGAANSPQVVSVTLTVTPGAAAVLTVAPGYAVLRPTLTQTLTLTARDAFNNAVSTAAATFTSRSGAVATVGAGGVVTGVAGGTSVVVATLGAASDSTVIAVAADGSAVASAIADGRAFRAAAVTDTVRVLVAVGLQGVSPERLGNYNAQLNWNTTALRYVRSEAVPGGFVAPTLNETQTASGQLRFASIDAIGHAGPTVGLVRVVFVANAAGSTPLTIVVTELGKPEPSFGDLLPAALVTGGHVKVQ